MTCINCGHEGEGKYCSNCTQPLEVKRLALKDVWGELSEQLSGFDGRFPRTFRDLTLRPGFAAREFIRGNRARYYGPVGYFFLMITLFLLLLSLLDLSYVEYLRSMEASISEARTDSQANSRMRQLIADNIKTFAFVVIPIQGFIARYFFFRKQGLNVLEHSVLPLYVTAHWYSVQIVEAVVFKYSHTTMGAGMQGLATALFFGYAYTSFVPGQSKIKLFFKGIGVSLMSFVFLTIVVAIIVVIAAMMNPDMLKDFGASK